MIIEKIDLYEYFNVKKPKGAKGVLTSYVIEQHSEHEKNRLRSAMLVLPGGGYAFCSQREAEQVARAYLCRGIDSFVLDYSVAPACTEVFPAALREAAMSMIYIRENAKKFGIDANFVSAVGFSAGGHLCGTLGTLYNCDELSDLRNCDLVRPTAVVLSYPVSISSVPEWAHMDSFYNLTGKNEELIKRLSLENCVNSFSSPAFIWHTYEDNAVPLEGTLVLAQAYKKNKVPFALHVFEKGGHGLSLATRESLFGEEPNYGEYCVQDWVELSVKWLKLHGFIIYS